MRTPLPPTARTSARCLALDHHLEAVPVSVAARGEDTAPNVPQISGLLLLGAGAEMKRAVLPQRQQRRHVRAAVPAHRGQPEDLRLLKHPAGVRPGDGIRARLTEAAIEVGHRIDGHGVLLPTFTCIRQMVSGHLAPARMPGAHRRITGYMGIGASSKISMLNRPLPSDRNGWPSTRARAASRLSASTIVWPFWSLVAGLVP